MSPRLDLVKSLITAYESLDSKSIEPFLADNFKTQVLPATLKGPERSKDEYLKWYDIVVGNLKEAKFEVVDMIEGKDAVVIHARNLGSFKDGTPYTNEYMVSWKFDEKDKVVYMKEFVDSAYVLTIRSKLVPPQ